MKINSLDDFLSLLDGVKNLQGNEYIALCPSHDDHNPSLSVTESNGKILINCFAGCSTREILRALKLKDSDLFLDSGEKPTRSDIVATYDYTNEEGTLLFQVCRTEDKAFPQRRPTADGWDWGLGDTRRVLYNLPAVKEAVQEGRYIFLVEGEKDADNLNKLDLAATCNPMGAGNWKKGYTETLEGANVVILPDNDDEGRKHAFNVAKAIGEKVESVKILDLPDLPDKGDVSDWLKTASLPKKQLKELVKEKAIDASNFQLQLDLDKEGKDQKKVKPAKEKGNIVTPEELRELTKERKNGNKLDVSINLSLPEDVYPSKGWLPDFMNYGEGVTDANKTLLYAGGLAMLSGTVGKTIALPHFGGSLLYPNLWICTLAPHGRHRKSTVINLVRNLLQKVDAWTILPDEITPEKLISNMNANNSTGVFAISEMASFLSLANRSYQGGFKPMLANWYDVPPRYTKEKMTGTDDEKKLVVEKPYITIFGGSTLEWFLESTSPTDVLGGLFSRMVFIPLTEKERDKVHWPEDLEGRQNIPENYLIKTLMDRFKPLREHWQKEGTLTLGGSRDAKEFFTEWAKAMDQEVAQGAETNKVGGFAERLQTVAKKVAILIEVSQPDFKGQIEKDNPELRLKSMERATEFVTEIWKVTRMLIERRFIHDQFAQRMQETLELVYENGEISRTNLIQTLQIKKRDLDELVQTMQEAGFIEELKVKPDGPGRPKQVYIPKDEGG